MIEAGLQSLVEDISPAEQQEIRGVMGFKWTPTQKIKLRFYLINSLRMRSMELYLCRETGLDVLISNTFFDAIRAEEKVGGRMLMLTGVRQTPGTSIHAPYLCLAFDKFSEQLAEQQALVAAKNASSIEWASARDRNKTLERATAGPVLSWLRMDNLKRRRTRKVAP